MLAFQKVAGFLVIELVGIPLDEREIRAVVIGVAAHAFLAGPRGNVVRGVQSALVGDARPNIRVTADAAELRFAATDLVAVGAMHRAIQKLMLARERARRNLGMRIRCEQTGGHEKQ